MNIGRFLIENLSEGLFEHDDTGSFVKVEEPGRVDPALCLGIEPIVIQDGGVRILLDAGLGWGLDHGSAFGEVSNVASNLDIFGWSPKDIDFVVLSHLHYDHCAGCSYVNEANETVATFPNAVILVRQAEWEAALASVQRMFGGSDQGLHHPEGLSIKEGNGMIESSEYRLDEFYKLIAEGRVHFLDPSPYTLLPGVQLIQSGGHTPGHQIVRLEDKGECAVFPGDLIPTEQDLNGDAWNSYHTSPAEAKKARIHLLRHAHEHQAELFFYHARFTSRGKVSQDNHFHYVLNPTGEKGGRQG